MELLIGGRLDKHNMMDHVIFSPRANIRFNPTEDINIGLVIPVVSVPRKRSMRICISRRSAEKSL